MEENTLLGVEDTLLGVNDEFIGNVAQKTGVSPVMVAKIANATRKKVFGFNSMATKAQRFLVAKVKELDAGTQKVLKSGQAKFRDADYYVRKRITGGGTTSFMVVSDALVIGLRNIDKAKLEPTVNLVLTKLRMGYATHATATDPSLVGYKNTDLALDPFFANGEIEVLCEGEFILKKTPVSRFFGSGADATDNTVQGYNDCVKLESLKLIKSQKVIEIKFHAPEGGTIPANNHFLEFRLLGEEIYEN